MLPSPSSSPVHPQILHNRTNVVDECIPPPHIPRPFFTQLPTPPTKHAGVKRVATSQNRSPIKRLKLSAEDESESSDDDEDEFVVEPKTPRHSIHRFWPQDPYQRAAPAAVSTRSILQSFVSSNKSDTFKCQSIDLSSFLTPPYACAYSHHSKSGGESLLAVATEQGSVHLIDTKKRRDWDLEPPRTTLQPHTNAIFHVAWAPTDELLATCSGDHSSKIVNVSSKEVLYSLRGHTGTVKCAAWNPQHQDLLSTGGRDGTICIWDLRVGENRGHNSGPILEPVMMIQGAHESLNTKPGRPKNAIKAKSVTNLVYNGSDSLTSSGSFDGILRTWDLRFLTDKKKSKRTKGKKTTPICISSTDPTTDHGARRPRGILSLAPGTISTSGLLFALGADSRIHTFSASTLTPLPVSYAHQSLKVNSSFYLNMAISPCGRWLASGNGGRDGSCLLFDVASAGRPFARAEDGIELKGQIGEVGAVDWAENMLATCSDDGTVRVWRPDIETYKTCVESPEQGKWDWSWSLS
ncbi:WD40 repeat-like protein [Dendrothele bispora CBS 962.96]|uniref:WD40 repeat-like protein n=1 Tax=Dendrothele bispora (strain CBS 962.96) TaxID=1314807 RepID=A0A4S8MS68_DENBC|nr:WD40 repeat-like protein [Dendrothele bispora CBS 962.96]